MQVDLEKVLTDVGTLGIVTFTIMAGFFWAWKNLWKMGDIANEKKILLVGATPIVVVNAIYLFGLSQGFWSASWDAWWNAMEVAIAEISGSTVLRGLLGLGEKFVEERKDA